MEQDEAAASAAAAAAATLTASAPFAFSFPAGAASSSVASSRHQFPANYLGPNAPELPTFFAPPATFMEQEDNCGGLDGAGSTATSFLSLPVEIHSKILFLLDPSDVLSYSRTCKACLKYATSQQLWRHQWYKLSRKTPFLFLPVASLVDFGANFKDACRRLWQILVVESAYGGLIPSKCVDCKEYTCSASCVEERSSKVSLDIGSKITWLITSNYTLKRHLSMVAVPKTLRCLDCDTSFDRNAMRCDCVPSPQDANPSLVPSAQMREAYCNNRLMSGHTALEYCSQPLSDLSRSAHSGMATSRPFCLFCDDDKVNRMMCEREMVSSTRHKMKSVAGGASSAAGAAFNQPFMTPSEDCFETVGDALAAAATPSVATPESLTNGYCRDTASILGANNLDLLSPLIALEHEDAFPVVKAFLTHLLSQYKMVRGPTNLNGSTSIDILISF